MQSFCYFQNRARKKTEYTKPNQVKTITVGMKNWWIKKRSTEINILAQKPRRKKRSMEADNAMKKNTIIINHLQRIAKCGEMVDEKICCLKRCVVKKLLQKHQSISQWNGRKLLIEGRPCGGLSEVNVCRCTSHWREKLKWKRKNHLVGQLLQQAWWLKFFGRAYSIKQKYCFVCQLHTKIGT